MDHIGLRSRQLVVLVQVALTASIALSAAITPSVANAAAAPPWRFKTIGYNLSVKRGVETGQTLNCPVGYRPISGGIAWSTMHSSADGVYRKYEYTDPPTRAFTLQLANSLYGSADADIHMAVNCVGSEAFGDVRYVTQNFNRASNDHAGGTVYCPTGYRVITGGADWTVHTGQGIDYSTPVLDANGYGVGWYASGFSLDSAKLAIEAYCVEDSYLDSEYAEVDLSAAATADGQNRSAQAFCKQGYRILTGGSYIWNQMSHPTQNHGYAWASGPSSVQAWPARAYVTSGDRLAAVALCIPASKVALDITTGPDTPTNSTDATFHFTASDQAGEDLLIRCQLDGEAQRPCTTESSSVYHGLAEGVHTFTVSVSNQSGSSRSIWTAWKIDLTKPELESWTPISSAPLTGPITMTFSEPVGGINGTTMKVLRNHGNAVVNGTIAFVSSTVVRWTPTRPLIPGETYSMVLDQAIHDAASNHLTTTYFSVRTDTNVENTSPGLTETWDTDTKSIASGGSYITSSALGSSADWQFTANAGQVASIFGIRLPDGGTGDVFLDGVKQRSASFFATSPARAKVFASGPLSAGPHRISVRPTGTHPSASTGSWVSIDSVSVGTTQHEETALSQAFNRVTLSSASGGSYDVVGHQTDGGGAPAYQVRVVGTGIEIYAATTPKSGKARILIDGSLQTTVDFHAASKTGNVRVFSATFADGLHVVRIEPVGTATGTASAVGIDRLVVQ